MPTPHEPNEKFRDARQSTESPTHPGYSLSRQELAELVNAWIWEHYPPKPGDKPVELDRNYIGKFEQGVIRWPGKVYREAFRAVLGVSTDAELGFVNTLSRRAAVKLKTVDPVKRQKFVHTLTAGGVVVSGLLLADPLTELLECIGDEPDPTPTRVGASDIAHIRTMTRDFASWGSTYGGGVVREIVMTQLRRSARLLNATCPDQLLPELHTALGELAEVAGFIALDAGAQEKARQVLVFGLACAEQAKDWPLRAEILSNMSAQAISTGQPDEGLTLADHALVRADRLTPAGRSLLHTDRACALAKMRRVPEALRAIGTADEHFADFTSDNEPSSMAFYTEAHHALYTGRPLVDLAILGHDPGKASSRLTTAVTGYPESKTRARAVCLSKLASLTMTTGDPRQAAAIGNEALEIAGTIRSHRSTDELRELFGHAAAYQDLSEVAELRHRIRTLIQHPPPQQSSPGPSRGLSPDPPAGSGLSRQHSPHNPLGGNPMIESPPGLP